MARKSDAEARQAVIDAIRNAPNGQITHNELQESLDERAVKLLLTLSKEKLIVSEVVTQQDAAPTLVYRLPAQQ